MLRSRSTRRRTSSTSMTSRAARTASVRRRTFAPARLVTTGPPDGVRPTVPVLTENSEDSMSSRRSMLLIVGACGALAFAVWSGGASSATSTISSMPGRTAAHGVARHGWLPPAAKQEKLLYVSDYTASIVLIYKQGATGSGPIGEIVDGISSPQGVATDKLGTLYVANQGTNTITEYPAGATSPSVTLSTD